MASSINASTSGAGGLISTADSSGVLNIQTAGTTAISVDASQNVTLTNVLPQASGGTGTTIGYNGFKNRIINGAMMIDQRAAGASTTPASVANFSYSSCDRWAYNISVASKFSLQQNAGSVTPPAGFKTYLGVTSLANTTLASGDYYGILQSIEGNNTTDLGFGAAGASSITLSFWVRSSATGTFSATIFNYAQTRNYVSSYTISAANTWEYKTITIPGDTGGTWVGATNAGSMIVYFGIAIGSSLTTTAGSWNTTVYGGVTGQVNVLATNGATFYITGVQLEKGSTATSFDYRPYGTEMGLCQRYYTKSYNDGVAPATVTDTGALSNTAQATSAYFPISPVSLPVEMRATPTVTIFNPVTGSSTASVCIRNINANTNHAGYAPVIGARYINLSTDNSSITTGNRAVAHFTASAEL